MAAAAPYASPPFVGRTVERDTYQQVLREERGPWLLIVSGQGGNGKSRLLRQFQAETPNGYRVGLLDFASERLRVDPLRVAEELGEILRPLGGDASYQQFRQADEQGRARLSQMNISLQQQIAIGMGAQVQGINQRMNIASAVNKIRRQVQEQVTGALLRLAGAGATKGRRLVLLLDTCEWFDEPGSQEVGDWLITDLLPHLRERLNGRLRVVAAGREPLRTPSLADETLALPLDLLPFPEVESYLGQIGMRDAALCQAVFAMTRGHPLCLTIVADLWRERPMSQADLPSFQGAFSDQAVMRWAQERILDKRMQPPYDDLVRYGVLLRSFDLPLLRQVFPEWLDAGDQVFQRLIRYSFILRLADGRYAFHDLLRQVQAAYVRRQLPERWQAYHERALRAWGQQREQVFGQQLMPPDQYYHRLALDEQEGGAEWDDAAAQVAIIGEQDYWGRFLQAAHDAALAPGPPFAAARAFHQGRFFYAQARWNAALASYQQALALYRQVGDRQGEANTLGAIGGVQQFHNNYDAALASYQQALTLYRQVGDRQGEANTLGAIGEVQQFRRDPDAALASYQQALTLYRQVGDRQGEANALRGIGEVQQFRQDPDAALASYQQALALYRQVGDRLGEASALRGIGGVQQFRNNYDAALASYQQALTLYRQVGDRQGEANTLGAIGEVQRFRSNTLGAIGEVQRFRQDPDAALASYQQAIQQQAMLAGDGGGEKYDLKIPLDISHGVVIGGERGGVAPHDRPVGQRNRGPEPNVTVERTASAAFPAEVDSGSENLLTYAIAKGAVYKSGQANLVLPAPEGIPVINLVVSVQASDFAILDPDTGRTRNYQLIPVDVMHEDATAEGQFLLRAHPIEDRLVTSIFVRFSHNGLPVGQITIPAVICPPSGRTLGLSVEHGMGSIAVSANGATAPDLIITVTDCRDGFYEIAVDRGRGRKQFYGKDLGRFPVTGNAWQYAQSVLNRFHDVKTLLTDAERQDRVDSLGLDLWRKLPEAFQRFYWDEMHGRNLSIALYSAEPYIPWELVKPQREPGGDVAPMLGLSFSMARWKQAAFFPNPVEVSAFAIIAPHYVGRPLDTAQDEAEQLKLQFGAKVWAGDYVTVKRLLKSTGVQAVHFTGHGAFEPALPDQSTIQLADRPLEPVDLRTATLGKSDAPLVFLNACAVGQEGWSLTQIGGWAEAFCDIGCSAFIGPYWAVSDLVAKKAAILFYTELRAGRTVGQAMQTIRRRFTADDEFAYSPTWLAYTLHSQPNVTVKFKKQPLAASAVATVRAPRRS